MNTPYDDALEHIRQHPGTGSAAGLGKLILSLFNADMAFSYRECIAQLDSRNTSIAQDMIHRFTTEGETEALRVAGREVVDLMPRLWQLGEAADAAKEALRRKWFEESRDAEDKED